MAVCWVFLRLSRDGGGNPPSRLGKNLRLFLREPLLPAPPPAEGGDAFESSTLTVSPNEAAAAGGEAEEDRPRGLERLVLVLPLAPAGGGGGGTRNGKTYNRGVYQQKQQQLSKTPP